MTYFTTLPLELRREIYSYLLLDVNVVEETLGTNCRSASGESVSLTPKFSTSLFQVSKQISQESLLYFYAENAFVLLFIPFFPAASTCRLLLPCIWPVEGEDETMLHGASQNVAMAAMFKHHHPEESDPECSTTTWPLVCSARHLPHFISILNSQNPSCVEAHKTVHIYLNFHLDRPPYADNAAIADLLVTSFKSLRISTFSKDKHPTFILSVSGALDDEAATNLRETTLAPFCMKDVLNNCRLLFQLGDEHSRHGRFAQADNCYSALGEFTNCIVTHATITKKEGCRAILGSGEDITIERLIRIAENAQRAQKFYVATECVLKAFYGDLAREHGRTAREERAYLLYRCGCVLAETGTSYRATSLSRALWMFRTLLGDEGLLEKEAPERRDLKIKIAEAERTLRRTGESEELDDMFLNLASFYDMYFSPWESRMIVPTA